MDFLFLCDYIANAKVIHSFIHLASIQFPLTEISINISMESLVE